MKTILSAVFAVALMCTAVTAQEEKCDKCPSSEGSAVAAKCDKCPSSEGSAVAAKCDKCPSMTAVANKEECAGECPVKLAMAKLPKMTYRVGTENTCCADSAAKMAEKAKAPLQYVVGEKVFDEKTAAFTSLVEQTETMVNKFVTPCKCEKSGTTAIAGASCKCPVEAGKKAELVSAAIKDIKMSYAVGEETCNCPMKAGEMAKAAKTEMKYVVAGESTCCSLDARHKLAVAKYKAAVKAVVAAAAPAKKATATSTSGS